MKDVIAFIVGVLIGGVILWLAWPDGSTHAEINWAELSDEQILRKMKTASDEQVQVYSSLVVHEALPENYVYQPHVVNAASPERANAAVKKRHPEFVVNNREDFYAAIRNNPIGYRSYAHEMTSVRLFFMSQRKSNQPKLEEKVPEALREKVKRE